jgi:hypothetical protein
MSFHNSTADENSELPNSEFTNWLAQNIDNIQNGTAVFQGQRVTRDSSLVRYFACASFIFATTRQISALMLEGSAEAVRTRLRSTLVTLFVGWWGLVGIVITPVYLFKNLTGGERMTVGEVLDNSEKIKDSASNFQIGPGQIIFALVGLLFLAGMALQAYVQIRRWLQH